MVSSAEVVWKNKFLNRVWICVIIHSEVLIQVNTFVLNVYHVPDTEKKEPSVFAYLDKRKGWLIPETGTGGKSQWIWNLNDWFDHLKSPNYATASEGLFPSQTSSVHKICEDSTPLGFLIGLNQRVIDIFVHFWLPGKLLDQQWSVVAKDTMCCPAFWVCSLASLERSVSREVFLLPPHLPHSCWLLPSPANSSDMPSILSFDKANSITQPLLGDLRWTPWFSRLHFQIFKIRGYSGQSLRFPRSLTFYMTEISMLDWPWVGVVKPRNPLQFH